MSFAAFARVWNRLGLESGRRAFHIRPRLATLWLAALTAVIVMGAANPGHASDFSTNTALTIDTSSVVVGGVRSYSVTITNDIAGYDILAEDGVTLQLRPINGTSFDNVVNASVTNTCSGGIGDNTATQILVESLVIPDGGSCTVQAHSRWACAV